MEKERAYGCISFESECFNLKNNVCNERSLPAHREGVEGRDAASRVELAVVAPEHRGVPQQREESGQRRLQHAVPTHRHVPIRTLKT